MNMSAILGAAIEYALAGIYVFPIHGIVGGKCTCSNFNCSSPGKHPLTKNGFKDASCDVDKIKIWWLRHPNANIGVPTGQVNGFVVIDVDPRHGGNESMSRLVERVGELPSTVVSQTGGGGRHIFFTCPAGLLKNRVNTVGYKGVDFRGDGGYVVFPPSTHASGGVYKWLRSLLEAGDE